MREIAFSAKIETTPAAPLNMGSKTFRVVSCASEPVHNQMMISYGVASTEQVAMEIATSGALGGLKQVVGKGFLFTVMRDFATKEITLVRACSLSGERAPRDLTAEFCKAYGVSNSVRPLVDLAV